MTDIDTGIAEREIYRLLGVVDNLEIKLAAMTEELNRMRAFIEVAATGEYDYNRCSRWYAERLLGEHEAQDNE